MVTVNAPKRKHLENEAKMHFSWTLAVLGALGTFKLPSKDFGEIIFLSPNHLLMDHDSLKLFTCTILFIKFRVKFNKYVLLTVNYY